MTRIELTRAVESPRNRVFDLMADAARWALFYNNITSVVDQAEFDWPGDRVGFEYRILGRIVSAEARLVAVERPDLLELEVEISEVVTSSHRWEFHADGDGTLVSVRLEFDEVTDWFGLPVGRYVVGRALQADLSRTLDNLADLMAAGLV